MIFLSPGRLWLLALAPLLITGYVFLQLRRKRHTVRFTNLAMLSQIAPTRPGWRRHVGAVAFLIAIVVMMLGFARPATAVRVPRDRATIMVAIDVSLSMKATDVVPNRFEAAKAAAKNFVRGLPPRFNVGVVGFAGTASVVSGASADREATMASIDRLVLGRGTAIGEAVFTALQAIRSVDAAASQDPPPAHIVLLSDGDNTKGRPVLEAIQDCRSAGVPVSTIAYGTPSGTIEVDGRREAVEVNKQTLRTLAEQTKGKAYEAADSGQLSAVYENIGSSLGWRLEHREVAARFTGIALLFALAAAGASLLWSSRLP